MAVKEIVAFYLMRKLLGVERSKKLDSAIRKYSPKTASIILGMVSVVHALRLVMGWDVFVAEWAVPNWVSVIAVIITAYLSYGLWPTKNNSV